LRAGRPGDGHDVAELDAAQAELTEALAALRAIARGLYPPVLSEMGLAIALEALAETASLPLEAADLPADRLSPAIEAAACFAVSELVRDPAAAQVSVRGRPDPRALVLQLITDAPGCEPTRIADRVSAAGGTVRARHAHGTIVLDMEIPCAS
jgi:signal transduction histidine kinase